MGGVPDLGDGVGRAGGQADGAEHRQVGQVVAHVADLPRRQAEPLDQVAERAGLVVVPLEHMSDLQLGRPALDGRRAPAREDRRLLARLVPEGDSARPSRTWKCLVSTPAVVERDDAVGQDAVDVGDQQLDRLAPRGQLGRACTASPMADHSSKSAGTSPIRSVTSIRPTSWPPRSTTGSSLILWAFISSTASASVAPTRMR